MKSADTKEKEKILFSLIWGNCSSVSRDKIKSVQIKKNSQAAVDIKADEDDDDDEEGVDDEESADPEYEDWSDVQLNKDLRSLITRIYMTHKGTCSGIASVHL